MDGVSILLVPETASDALHHAVGSESPSGGSLAGQQSCGPSLRVLIVSDVRFFREGLSETLPHLSRISVVATAEDGDQALARALALNPDVILLDTGLPDGLGIVASLVGAVPTIPVVAMAVAETEHAILTWVEAGVAGYVHRSASIIELIDTVILATRGEQVCSTKVAGAMLRRLHQLAATARQDRYGTTEPILTQREGEVAQLVADGLSNKLIAQRLNSEGAACEEPPPQHARQAEIPSTQRPGALRQERYGTTEPILTQREGEVAQLVADGLSNKLIAQRLNSEGAACEEPPPQHARQAEIPSTQRPGALRQERYSTTEPILTQREGEVAQLVADGLSNKLIAQRLNIEVATVKCHIHNMLDKLKLHRRSDLALWVCQRGLDLEVVGGQTAFGLH